MVGPTLIDIREHIDGLGTKDGQYYGESRRKPRFSVNTDDATIEIVDEMTFQADPDRLRHVFESLFRNAVEHGGSDVTVRVGCHSEQGIYVEDSGPSIPVKKHDEVFEPRHSSAQGGTGFGLTIVKRIVEAHGWELSVADGTDGGARFDFEMSEQGEFV